MHVAKHVYNSKQQTHYHLHLPVLLQIITSTINNNHILLNKYQIIILALSEHTLKDNVCWCLSLSKYTCNVKIF